MNLRTKLKSQENLQYFKKAREDFINANITDITSYQVVDSKNTKIGTVSDIIIDTQQGNIKYAQVEVNEMLEKNKYNIENPNLSSKSQSKIVPFGYLKLNPSLKVAELSEEVINAMLTSPNINDKTSITSEEDKSISSFYRKSAPVLFDNKEGNGILNKGFIKGRENFSKKNFNVFDVEVK